MSPETAAVDHNKIDRHGRRSHSIAIVYSQMSFAVSFGQKIDGNDEAVSEEVN